LIVDWIIQSKIDSSLKQAQNARKTVERSVIELEELKKIIQGKISELQEKRALLLERA